MLPAAAFGESTSANAVNLNPNGESAAYDDDDDFDSYDMDLLEKGAVVGEEDVRSVSMHLARLIFSNESVLNLIKMAIAHVIRWLKRLPLALAAMPSGGVKEASVLATKEKLKALAIRTHARLALANLRFGSLKWSELVPQIRQLKMPLETGTSCGYLAFFSSLLEAAATKLGPSHSRAFWCCGGMMRWCARHRLGYADPPESRDLIGLQIPNG